MNPVEAFLAGIAPEHLPALVAGVLAALWLSTAPPRRGTTVDRWAGALLGVSAAVHLALPLNPHHGPLVTAGFLLSGIGYALLARRARHGRRWRLPAALLMPATIIGYLAAIGSGEEPDQVGIATALVELTALGLAIVPSLSPWRPRRLARFTGSAATAFAVFLVGAIVWVASFQAHEAADLAVAATEPAGEHAHQHEHTGRTQAGVIMRPLPGGHHATEEQQRAAAELAAGTAAATARYADIGAAFADGYHASLRAEGTDVHLESKERKEDGGTLDPQRPEMLVYAIEGGRATLLGVVYVMDVAGRPGPTPGGPITGWHAHNLCVSALPPGFGVVSPYGGCPAFSVSVTSPEMMHVWVVDNPDGPFADGLDEQWVRAYHAEHGRPFTGR